MNVLANIFAYTSMGDNEYPEFLSVNKFNNEIVFTVRGPKKVSGGVVTFPVPGERVAITLPRKQVEELCVALMRELAGQE